MDCRRIYISGSWRQKRVEPFCISFTVYDVAVKAKPECCSEQNRNEEYTLLHETANIK